MNEKNNTSASYMDGNKSSSIIFQENTTNPSFEDSDVASRLYQFESLQLMERHYIKDLIKSMFRMDAESNNNNTEHSNEDLLSVTYSTDDEAEIAEITNNSSDFTKSKSSNDGVHHSPETMVGPRSVKEAEESHASLKKENFNLKLRIYFLEERMNTDFNINPDNAVMKNIELKVQVESLRKELAEKQEMLCQAVKTMELDEDDYKKLLAERNKKILDLEKDFQNLERKYEDIHLDNERSHGDIILPDPEHLYESLDFEANISELENKLGEEHDENVRLKISLDEEIRSRDLRIRCLEAEVEEKSSIMTDQHKRIVSLESDMEKRYLEIKRLKEDRSEDIKHISELEATLRESQQAIENVEHEYEHESMKVNRIKLSLSQRNKRIMELEDIVRRQKTHIGTLEAQVRKPQLHNEYNRTSIQTSSVATPAVAVSPNCAVTFSALSGEVLSTPPTQNQSVNNSNSIDITNDNSTHNIDQQSGFAENSSAADNDQSTNQSSGLAVVDEQQLTSTNILDPKVLLKNLDDSLHHISKLEKDRRRAGEIIHNMIEKRKQLQQEISKLKEEQIMKDQQLSQLKQTIQDLKKDSCSKNDDSITTRTLPNLSAQSSSEVTNHQNLFEESDINILCVKYQTLANDLDTQKELLLAIIKEKDNQMQKLELNYNIALTDMNIKDERISALENTVQENNRTNQNSEKLDVGSEKQSTSFWIIESEEKDREIEKLEADLKQRNTDIQTLVNKELWEKNREISKAQQLVRLKDSELDKLSREMELLKSELGKIAESTQENTSKDDDIQRKLRNSIEDRKKILDQLEVMYTDSPDPEIDTHKDYLHLKNEYKQLKDDFERSERLREQTNDICSVLSTRLEELAFFLDSLLKQKSLLGFLGSKKNCKLRQIIDESLDLSRTLNMNLSQMNPDQSLLQLTNISNFFNSATSCNNEENNIESNTLDIEEEKAQIINEQTRIINALRQQIETMKNQLSAKQESVDANLCNYDESVVNILLDISKMDDQNEQKKILSPQMILQNLMSEKLNIQQNDQLLNTTSTTLKYWQENNSTESESWSEPDRNVSKQRIGLNPLNLTGGKVDNLTDDTNTEEERKMTKSKRNNLILLENKQLVDENRELKEKINANNDVLLQTEQSFCTISEQLKKELKILDALRLENENLRQRITDKESQLNTCESMKLSNQKQIMELHKLIDDLHKQQDELKASLDVKNKECTNKINQLEQEKSQATSKTLQAEEDSHKLKIVIQNYEAGLKDLYKEKMHLEGALRQESELIQKQAEDFKIQVQQLRDQSENEVKRITETALTMKQKYESEYVKRAELDKMMSSIKELESLQMVLNTTEEKIQLLEDNEAKLKATLQDTHQDYREKLAELRKELNLSTLKFSEIMLEKTRQMKEKAGLEVQIKEYASKEEDFKRQVAEFQQALNSMKGVFQIQVENLNSQKSALQLKLKEVELVNDELKNAIGKIDSKENTKTSNSAPNTPSKFFSLFMGRQFSYSNEESHIKQTSVTSTNQSGDHSPLVNPQQENIVNVINIPVDYELVDNRAGNNGNTSPDLGIESDQGRFSSLENNPGNNRPFLNTLELSQQMQNLLLNDEQGEEQEQNNQSPKDRKNICKNSPDNGRCLNVIVENSQLREKLLQTRSALEETVSQLKYANEKKKHVEKTICKQIHKTSQVLRKAKANLDSGSETDVRK